MSRGIFNLNKPRGSAIWTREHGWRAPTPASQLPIFHPGNPLHATISGKPTVVRKENNPAMSRVQFYAFTPPTFPPGETTPFLQAFKETDDTVTVSVRGSDGKEARISIDTAEARRLSIALGAAKFAHAVVAARAERDALQNPVETAAGAGSDSTQRPEQAGGSGPETPAQSDGSEP